MDPSLNLVFCGTPEFAVPTLDKLVESGFHIQLVVTQPDRPKGRGLGLVASPVKLHAIARHLPITQPQRIKENAEFRDRLTSLKPDAIVVVGYGRIIPPWMLDLPPLGNVNLHASLLPRYRGAAPIQWAIANGETITGVSTMKIDEGLDTGDILLQRELAIGPRETAETLSLPLAAIGAELMVETLHGLQSGKIRPRPQDGSQATFAPILKKEDGWIDFARPADEILNRMRGFQPWPGAYTQFRGKKLRILSSSKSNKPASPAMLLIEGESLIVGCGGGSAIEILELQVEGKKRNTASEFIRGYRPRVGEQLGS